MTTETPWWKKGVIYQIYPRSFVDSNGDGIGDIPGIISKLDYLNDGTPDSLGVDGLWLSPIFPSPQVDFGYDVSDYCDIDPVYGTLDDFDRLVEEAGQRGMKIVLDLVVNHTSSQHSWFAASRSARDNSKRDWYIWRDGRGKSPPNNWQSVFNESAWTFDETTGQYYLHSFHREQPDLNWRNPEVREAVWESMKFWLDRGVAGFRLDVFNQYYKDKEFRSNPRKRHPLWFLGGLFYPYIGQKHLYDRDQPEMMEVVKKMREIVDGYPGGMLVGETLDEESDFSRAGDYYGENHDGLHLVFNFEIIRKKWRKQTFSDGLWTWQDQVPDGDWPTYVLSNHDVPRHISRYRRSGETLGRAKVAAAFLLTVRGTPFVYYGEEIGLAEAKLSRDQLKDPVGVAFWPFYKGRDGCRTPMVWEPGEGRGFTTGEPWLPLFDPMGGNSASEQSRDAESLFSWYRRLIWFRKSSNALHSGDIMPFPGPGPGPLLVFGRAGGRGERLVVALNFDSKPVRWRLDMDGEVVLASRRDREGSVGREWKLDGYEVLIVQTQGENQ